MTASRAEASNFLTAYPLNDKVKMFTKLSQFDEILDIREGNGTR